MTIVGLPTNITTKCEVKMQSLADNQAVTSRFYQPACWYNCPTRKWPKKSYRCWLNLSNPFHIHLQNSPPPSLRKSSRWAMQSQSTCARAMNSRGPASTTTRILLRSDQDSGLLLLSTLFGLGWIPFFRMFVASLPILVPRHRNYFGSWLKSLVIIFFRLKWLKPTYFKQFPALVLFDHGPLTRSKTKSQTTRIRSSTCTRSTRRGYWAGCWGFISEHSCCFFIITGWMFHKEWSHEIRHKHCMVGCKTAEDFQQFLQDHPMLILFPEILDPSRLPGHGQRGFHPKIYAQNRLMNGLEKSQNWPEKHSKHRGISSPQIFTHVPQSNFCRSPSPVWTVSSRNISDS